MRWQARTAEDLPASITVEKMDAVFAVVCKAGIFMLTTAVEL